MLHQEVLEHQAPDPPPHPPLPLRYSGCPATGGQLVADQSTAYYCSHLEYDIRSAGTYWLVVEGKDAQQIGPYALDFGCLTVPTFAPTPSPSPLPSLSPSGQPSPAPSPQPSAVPSPQPSGQPSPAPSGQPSAVPSARPTAVPTPQPTHQPSPPPTRVPTPVPSPRPSGGPSPAPSRVPSPLPTPRPSGVVSGVRGVRLEGHRRAPVGTHSPSPSQPRASERAGHGRPHLSGLALRAAYNGL